MTLTNAMSALDSGMCSHLVAALLLIENSIDDAHSRSAYTGHSV